MLGPFSFGDFHSTHSFCSILFKIILFYVFKWITFPRKWAAIVNCFQFHNPYSCQQCKFSFRHIILLDSCKRLYFSINLSKLVDLSAFLSKPVPGFKPKTTFTHTDIGNLNHIFASVWPTKALKTGSCLPLISAVASSHSQTRPRACFSSHLGTAAAQVPE